MSRRLAGSCQVPLGGFAEVVDNGLRLRGFVASVDGVRMVSDEVSGARSAAEGLGTQLGERLLAMGAEAILAELEQNA